MGARISKDTLIKLAAVGASLAALIIYLNVHDSGSGKTSPSRTAPSPPAYAQENTPEPKPREYADPSKDLSVLRAFAEAWKMELQADAWAMEREDCAFGPKRWLSKLEENPAHRICMDKCFDGPDSRLSACRGKCWAAMGGQKTPVGRKKCHVAFGKKIKKLAKDAYGRAESEIGCAIVVYKAFADAATKAANAEIEMPVSYFPPESHPRGACIDSMKLCVETHFSCSARVGKTPTACEPRQLANVLELSGHRCGRCRLLLKDGREVDVKTLDLKQ